MLCIVIPAYNEAGCISDVVGAWLEILKTAPGKLIVVNDGSRDKTPEILDALAKLHPNLTIIHQQNGGHGSAILRGYSEALKLEPSHVFQTDGDNQFDPADFFRLWDLKRQAPMVLGYRQKRNDPRIRKLISSANRLLIELLFGVKLRDANIPFRLFEAAFLKEILKKIPAGVFAPNILIAVEAKRTRSKVLEVAVQHRERKTGTVSISGRKLIKICWRCAREFVAYRQSNP